jgi:hypothetical protein
MPKLEAHETVYHAFQFVLNNKEIMLQQRAHHKPLSIAMDKHL